MDRCLQLHAERNQGCSASVHSPLLFGVVEGGLDVTARKERVRQLTNKTCVVSDEKNGASRIQQLHGYVIGGLGGGESRDTREQILLGCLAPNTPEIIDARLPRLLPLLGTPVFVQFGSVL